MKIAIVGYPGSGKSTLALKLHQILHIPLFHIDQYFWKPGWQGPDRQEFTQIHQDLCAFISLFSFYCRRGPRRRVSEAGAKVWL